MAVPGGRPPPPPGLLRMQTAVPIANRSPTGGPVGSQASTPTHQPSSFPSSLRLWKGPGETDVCHHRP